MKLPVQVTFHGLDHSDAVEERIHEKVAKLEQFSSELIGCRVTVEKHHSNSANTHKKGEPFHVSITVSVPGSELVVKRDPKNPEPHEDIGIALRDAFQTMERQVKEWADRRRA